jgi:periplasmic copper chaperone A
MKATRLLMLVTVFVFAAAAASAQNGQLAVDNAWARATPGKSETGAAYVTIRSPTADRLVAASTSVAKKAELHTMTMAGMVMKMRPVAGVDIPAGQPVTLAPGGYHIMLMGLAKPLTAGQSFPLTLTFAKAGTRTVDVAVEKVGAAGPMAMPMPAMH